MFSFWSIRSKSVFWLALQTALMSAAFAGGPFVASYANAQAGDETPPLQDTNTTVSVYDVTPVAGREVEENPSQTIEFDSRRAISGLQFIENQDQILQDVLEMTNELSSHLNRLRAAHGDRHVSALFKRNDIDLTVYRFEGGQIEHGEDLTDSARIAAAEARYGRLLYKAEPTLMTVEGAHQEMVIRVVDFTTGIAFVVVDPDRVPLDAAHLQLYVARQKVLSGQSSGRKGRDVMLLSIRSSQAIAPTTITEARYSPRHPWYTPSHWRDAWRAYYQPTLWPESLIEATWSTLIQMGTTAASNQLAKFIIPAYNGDSNLMMYMSVAFGMGVGMQNTTYRNWVNAGQTTLERTFRRSALGVTFAVTYSILSHGTVQHLSLIDTSGLLNWAALLGNVALAKVGSDPISDFSRIRSEMRVNTKRMTFAPPSQIRDLPGEELSFDLMGKRVRIPWVHVTGDVVYLAAPGLTSPWESRMKWQAFEAPLVNIVASFSKLFDQIMMGAAVAGASTGHDSVAYSAALFMLGKSFLVMQIPLGRRLVLWYAEHNQYEYAPKMRESWSSWFTVGGWAERLQRLPSLLKTTFAGIWNKAERCSSLLTKK